jgi:molybdate transport system substrate-binding protein
VTGLRRAAVGLASALVALPLAGCGADGGSGRLTVLAAASLTDVYEDLGESFEEEQEVEVTFSFGSSTDLAEQAAEGAPGDVLATADETAMALAQDAGVTGDVETVATNVLTIVTPPGNPAAVRGLEDLAGTTWVRCADEAPCGRVALAVLDARGITATPASLEDDVRAALDKVVAGEVDAGLVYATDAVAAGDGVEIVPIPGAEEQETAYLTATLDQAGDPDLARAWVDHVTSEEGRAALEAAGFTVP